MAFGRTPSHYGPLGETLRQARLDKGVSLADASRDTRIRRSYLEALEAEDLAALPPAVYTRGFLKTYAEYLGLSGEAMVDLYQPNARRESGPPTLRAAVPRVAIPRQIPLRPVFYGVACVVFIAVFGFAWNLYQDMQHTLRETGDTTLAAGRRGTPTSTGPRLPTLFPIAVASPSPTATPTPEPTLIPSPTPVVDGILVELRTNARVYIEAAVDGNQVVAKTFEAGAQQTLPLAKESVIMRASIGSAVDLTVNGVHQEPQTVSDPVEFSWRR
jgi:cytoskeleton protein RodZ